MPRRRTAVLVVVTVLVSTAGWLALNRAQQAQAACTATVGASSFTLDPEQAANATTIAAEAYRQGMPHHAVSVGLAAAFQESKLRNLHYGDRDSLGLFQQRPSQGWGDPAQLLDPRYASAAFFRGLRRVHGWQSLPITVAAQRVQRSGAPAAYAAWDTESRTVARGLTGETPGGFSCRFPSVPRATTTTGQALSQAASTALGEGALNRATTPTQGWLAASWLMARASTYSVSRVSFDGWTWTPAGKGWLRDTTTRPAGVSFLLRGVT